MPHGVQLKPASIQVDASFIASAIAAPRVPAETAMPAETIASSRCSVSSRRATLITPTTHKKTIPTSHTKIPLNLSAKANINLPPPVNLPMTSLRHDPNDLQQLPGP